MHWVSVVQQDFFIKTFKRNPRLEGHSCPKILNIFAIPTVLCQRELLIFKQRIIFLQKKLEQKKTDLKILIYLEMSVEIKATR